MEKLIFVDVETSGLDEAVHEIIEICIIRDNHTYYRKVKPLHINTASPEALRINRFSFKEWDNASEPSSVALEIAHYFSGATIVAHNPHFDMRFIEELFHQYQVEISYDRRFIDTTVLAHEHLIPAGIKSLSMDSIRDFFSWEKEGAHSAKKDCEDVKRLYYKLLRASIFNRWFWLVRGRLKNNFPFCCLKKFVFWNTKFKKY